MFLLVWTRLAFALLKSQHSAEHYFRWFPNPWEMANAYGHIKQHSQRMRYRMSTENFRLNVSNFISQFIFSLNKTYTYCMSEEQEFEVGMAGSDISF